MSQQRPNLSDMRADSHSSSFSSGRGFRSPRVHIAGEAPPELSPLDAFALQSRILARQLQEGTKDGNRMSRLPPLTLESPLVVQGRSDYFRSMSYEAPPEDADEPILAHAEGLGMKHEVEDAFQNTPRPMSMHPRMSRIPQMPDTDVPALPQTIPEVPSNQSLHDTGSDLLTNRKVRSPSPILSETQSLRSRKSEKSPARKNSASQPASSGASAISNYGNKPSLDGMGLVPPKPFLQQRSASALSSSPPTFGDDDSSSISGVTSHPSAAAVHRKPSAASTVFGTGSFHRSSSVGSDSSAFPRPSFNFSRPLSRAGTPSFDMPARQASSDSHPSFVLADDAHTPVSMHSDAFLEQQNEDKGANSYVYSKFTLPRGKALERGGSSSDAEAHANSDWQRPVMPLNNQRLPHGAPPSPPTRPSSSAARVMADDTAAMLSRPSVEMAKGSLDIPRTAGYPSPNSSRPSEEISIHSEDDTRGRALKLDTKSKLREKTPASANTSDTASTIKASNLLRSTGNSSAIEMTAEEHLAKGIKCHENGSLNESTYHLRLAAKQNNPTAMLLYALACRHGWGMRANQREGVEWLRKAAEYASIELALDEDQAKEGHRVNFLENKTRKAQFALSIYELGVSHMNGWGIEQDKTLALRCFEIAGNWGDVDALAEAGFCYAKGIGCKKNLKKSAGFYRQAEAKGMSMIGNSWIHKSKYNEDKNDAAKDKDKDAKKKGRSKSRTRALFGFKSSS